MQAATPEFPCEAVIPRALQFGLCPIELPVAEEGGAGTLRLREAQAVSNHASMIGADRIFIAPHCAAFHGVAPAQGVLQRPLPL